MTMETDEFQEAISDLSEEKANIIVAFLTNAVNDAKENSRKQTLEEVQKDVDDWGLKDKNLTNEETAMLFWVHCKLEQKLREMK
jgi:hypothetical protein